MANRAANLAKKIRSKGKGLAKNKGLRRALDSVLTDRTAMAVIPYGGMVSKAYSSVKAAAKTSSTTVSPCLKKWFNCLTVPFAQESQGACIPSGGNMSSMRSLCYLRGEIVVGTNGLGFLQLTPNGFNDVVFGVVTDASFAGVDAEYVFAGGVNPFNAGVNPIVCTNARFASLSAFGSLNEDVLTPPVQCRLVGGGLKVYYTGTQLNRGGLISIYTHPQHLSVNAASYDQAAYSTPTILGNYQETFIAPITGEVYEYPLAPLREIELDYPLSYSQSTGTQEYLQNSVYPWSTGYTFPGGLTNYYGQLNLNMRNALPSTIVMVTGVPGNTLQFEIALHAEYIGDLTQGMRSPADSDPVGTDAMMAALSRLMISRNSSPNSTTADVLRKELRAVQATRNQKVSL